MDINLSVNSVKPTTPSPTYTAPKRSEMVKEAVMQQTKNAEVDTTVNATQQIQDLSEPEKARFDTVMQSVKTQAFKNFYAVNDTTFSIYKDSSGQFITRFTDLRTGKITYIPEPDVLDFMQRIGDQRAALVEVQA